MQEQKEQEQIDYGAYIPHALQLDLPCSNNDYLYMVNPVYEYICISQILYTTIGIDNRVSYHIMPIKNIWAYVDIVGMEMIGKKIFTTYEEAEKALNDYMKEKEERKNKHE